MTEYIFKNVFIINAHGSVASDRVTPTRNVKMIKSFPGVSIPQVVSNYLFGQFTRVDLPLVYSAENILKNIKDFYTTHSAEFYSKIYLPGDLYTNNIIEFDALYTNEDNGDILHIQDNGFAKTFRRFRDIPHIKNSIIDMANFNIEKQKYIVKLSDIINILNVYMRDGPYLLVVLSCSYIDDYYEINMRKTAAALVPIDAVYKALNDNGYYKKYLKYKRRYLNLKNNKTIQ